METRTSMNKKTNVSAKLKTIAAFIIVVIINQSIYSQDFNWLSYENYTQSFVAEMHSPLIKLEIIKMNKFHSHYYINNSHERPFMESQVGIMLPVFSYEKKYESGNLNIALTTPLSILTLVDMFENTTAPLINSDYRYGVSSTLIFSPKKIKSFIKNYHITLVPIVHECTHIGDEYALHGYAQIPDFARINLSYEVWQIFAGINRLHDEKSINISAEIGYQRLMPYKVGYYAIDPLEVKDQDIILSNNRDKWIFRAEYYHPLNFNKERSGIIISSTEISRDTKFGYSLFNTETRAWSMNFYFGFRIPIKNTHKQFGIYYRYYRGIIPYGQLRDENGFVLNGISFIIN